MGSRPMRTTKEEDPHVKQYIKVGWKNGSVALVENWGFVLKTHVRQLTAIAFNSGSRGSNALSGLVWPLNSYGQISTQTHNQNKTKSMVVCACLVCMSPWGSSPLLSFLGLLSPALLPDPIPFLTWTLVLVITRCPDGT